MYIRDPVRNSGLTREEEEMNTNNRQQNHNEQDDQENQSDQDDQENQNNQDDQDDQNNQENEREHNAGGTLKERIQQWIEQEFTAEGPGGETPFQQEMRHMSFRAFVRGRHAWHHFFIFLKWIVIALMMGVVCGVVGAAFRKCLDFAASWSGSEPWTIYLLPAAGLLIVFSYRILGITKDEGTNSILRTARGEDTSSLRVAPLIFFATFLTHFCQGSAGREGAALQIGGSIGSFIGRKLNFSKYEHQMAVLCGMSASFCALLGTPLTAAVFSIEVAGVGTVFYAGLVPSVLASMTAMITAKYFGVTPMVFAAAKAQAQDPLMFGKVMIISVIMALMSIVYCFAMHSSMRIYARIFKNPYIRVIAGGVIVILLTLLFGSRRYNGVGMPVIAAALAGEARPQDFILKLILTALTLGAGYKGGEIIPTFFIGASLGCVLAPLLGLDPMFAAEIGLIALFCGSVNCPISSILMSVELFGGSNFVFFGTAAAVSYMLSGYYSLYSGQKFMNSKLIPIPFERTAK
jgi:H+/Cl- antiporter ClcA